MDDFKNSFACVVCYIFNFGAHAKLIIYNDQPVPIFLLVLRSCLIITFSNCVQVSLLLLAFMSMERFLFITSPFGYTKLNQKTAKISLVLIWGLGLIMAIVPGFKNNNNIFIIDL